MLCLRVLTLALLSLVVAGIDRLAAAPVLFFLNQPAGTPGELIAAIGVPFAIDIAADGNFSRLYQNATGVAITDFHFRSTLPESDVWQGGGGAPPPFFQFVSASADRMGLDFVQGPLGTGIAPGAVFEITGTGFTANADGSLAATPTVPEPSTLILCGAGVVGLIAIRRARSRIR